MRVTFPAWLTRQQYNNNTSSTILARLERVERAYGDLDQHYDADRLESVISDLQYTRDDERIGRTNKSRLNINGDLYSNLATYRSAIQAYKKFRDSGAPEIDISPANGSLPATQHDVDRCPQWGAIERDMQAAFLRSIEEIEAGLAIIECGLDRFIASGFIDITARDRSGVMVAIEVKLGTAGPMAVAQLLSYMGDLALSKGIDGGVRGILVAADFDQKAIAAARMIPNLLLRRYRVLLQLSEASL
jgi:hypothetical protein